MKSGKGLKADIMFTLMERADRRRGIKGPVVDWRECLSLSMGQGYGYQQQCTTMNERNVDNGWENIEGGGERGREDWWYKNNR